MPLYGMVQVDGMFGKKNDQVSIDFEEHCWDVPCHCMVWCRSMACFEKKMIKFQIAKFRRLCADIEQLTLP